MNRLPVLANNGDITDFNEGNTTISNSFKVKEKITDQTGNNGTKIAEIMVSIKYLSNFWRTLEMPLINCEVELMLQMLQIRFLHLQ